MRVASPLGAGCPRVIRLVLAVAALAAPVPVSAQAPEETSDPSPSGGSLAAPVASADPGDIDIGALMPAELGGVETDVMVERGDEHLDGLDADDPADARERADIERFLEATGATIEGLTTASAVAIVGDRALIVAAARVTGAEPAVLRDAYVALLSEAMEDAVVTPGELAGKEVTILTSGGMEGSEPVYVYAVADTVWLLAVPMDAAVALLAGLP